MRHFARALYGRLAYIVLIPWVLGLREANRAYVLLVDERRKEVLLVKNLLGSGAWVFPGGGQHAGENHRSTACREVEEEIGLKLNPDKLTELCQLGSASRLRRGCRVYFSYAIKKQPVRYNQREILTAAWHPIDDCAGLKKELRPVVACLANL